MVTERSSGGSKNVLNKSTKEMLNLFGRSDIELIRRTEMKDSDDRLVDIHEDRSTISGDLQYITFRDKEIISSGQAVVGNAAFYAESTLDLQIDDLLIVGSQGWRLTTKAESDTMGVDSFLQVWICQRAPVQYSE